LPLQDELDLVEALLLKQCKMFFECNAKN